MNTSIDRQSQATSLQNREMAILAEEIKNKRSWSQFWTMTAFVTGAAFVATGVATLFGAVGVTAGLGAMATAAVSAVSAGFQAKGYHAEASLVADRLLHLVDEKQEEMGLKQTVKELGAAVATLASARQNAENKQPIAALPEGAKPDTKVNSAQAKSEARVAENATPQLQHG